MQSSLVLTMIGPDRTGLVEAVAAAIADHGGSWVESRMVRLAGQFTGLLLAEVPQDRRDALMEALHVLQTRQGLHVTVQAVDEPDSAAPLRTLIFEMMGHDRPGIVRQVSRALTQRHVNVIDLETQVSSAPMSGEPLFRARVEASVPPAADADELRDALEAIASELAMDLTFE